MTFPESERVIYQKNPLAEVSVELRFPPILKIDASPPADFQDKIRSTFSDYGQSRDSINIPPNAPQAVQKIMKSLPLGGGPVNHLFTTGDKKQQVILTREKVALKSLAYTRWEDFNSCFDHVRKVFEEIYQPSFYSKISLKYVDVIRRSILGLNDVRWSELLTAEVGGALTSPELAQRIDSSSSEFHCSLDDPNSFLTLKTSIALAEPGREHCFVINSEFHTHSKTETANVEQVLGTFNRSAGQLFRWAIQRRLHDALQPNSVA